jgi:hypothetical protein
MRSKNMQMQRSCIECGRLLDEWRHRGEAFWMQKKTSTSVMDERCVPLNMIGVT